MMSGSPECPMVELTKDWFLQELDGCLQAAIRGQADIVTQEGERYAAMVSMAEYAQLHSLKVLLRPVGLGLLLGHSFQD